MTMHDAARPVVSLVAFATIFFLATLAGRANALPGRYLDNSDGTVLDTQTKLIWQQGYAGPSTWTAALSYCQSNGAGLPGSGWRLPNIKELQTLVDEGSTIPAIDQQFFPMTPSDLFWSSSPYAGNPPNAWVVSFYGGLTGNYGTSNTGWVRCVR